MGKLRITRVKQLNNNEWAIRFAGSREAVKSLMMFLESQKTWARWNPYMFEGSGAWVVDHYVLTICANRFHNFEEMTGIRQAVQVEDEALHAKQESVRVELRRFWTGGMLAVGKDTGRYI